MNRIETTIIKGKTYFLVPQETYINMTEALEDAADEAALAEALARNEEGFPIALWDAIWAGESPVRAFRNHRGLTQVQLAEKAQVERVQLSNIENGKAQGSVSTLKRIATTLNVPLDALVPDEPTKPARKVAKAKK